MLCLQVCKYSSFVFLYIDSLPFPVTWFWFARVFLILSSKCSQPCAFLLQAVFLLFKHWRVSVSGHVIMFLHFLSFLFFTLIYFRSRASLVQIIFLLIHTDVFPFPVTTCNSPSFFSYWGFSVSGHVILFTAGRLPSLPDVSTRVFIRSVPGESSNNSCHRTGLPSCGGTGLPSSSYRWRWASHVRV